MELEKTIVQCCRERGKAFSQITLEDDYIIPDVRSDVIKIIHTQGELVFEEPKVSNQALWVSGKMNFRVLYRSEDSVRVIESVSGSLPFQEKLLLDGIEENDKIRISGKFEDVSAVLINSRKLAIRAVVNVLAVAETEGREEIVGALSMEGNCQQRQVEQKLLNLMDCKKDLIRVRREIKLPSSKANISEIIFKHVRIQNLEKGVTADGIGINAEAVLCILYRSEEDERIEWYETKTSFSGSMEDRRFRESDIFWIHVELASYDIDVRDDYDGEQRSLAIDFSVNMTANIWREEEVTVLKDVYSLGCELLPSYQRVEMEQFWMQTQARVRVGDVVHLDQNQEKIMQICSSDGEVLIEHMVLRDEGIFVEGMLKVNILYLTNNDHLPVAQTEMFFPVEQLIEIPRAPKPIRYEMNTDIVQLQVNLLDSSSFEVKALVCIDVIAFMQESFDKIVAVDVQAMDMNELQKSPGLVGYRMGENEELWDVAKKYHTTVEKILETNELQVGSFEGNKKLVIVKEIDT